MRAAVLPVGKRFKGAIDDGRFPCADRASDGYDGIGRAKAFLQAGNHFRLQGPDEYGGTFSFGAERSRFQAKMFLVHGNPAA